MKNAIKEYIELTDDEKKELWENATFVFDTNVFFNLYRYSKKTRDVLIDAMAELKDRIWMPYHVAYEFMRKRPEIIYESARRYSNLEDEILRPCKEKLRIKDDDSDFNLLQRYVHKWIEQHKSNNLLVETTSDDPILEKILQLFDGKTGVSYTVDELEKIKKEGIDRYKKKIPPGFKDANKENSDNDNNTYGDLIIWKQIMDYAKSNNKNVIFVTHDQKEDWWNILHGKTLGPREELKKEFSLNTNMQFNMYTMDSFVSRYQTVTDSKVDTSIINEVKSYTYTPLGAFTLVREFGEYASLLGDTLRADSLPELNEAIEFVKTKKARREMELESIAHKYHNKKKPSSVQKIEKNLEGNIRQDEKILYELTRRRNSLAHGFFSEPN